MGLLYLIYIYIYPYIYIFPKSEVMGELNKQSVIQWQREWDSTTKGAIKSFFPKIVDRMRQGNRGMEKIT